MMMSANESIPIKKYSKRKISVPWWNKDCDKAVRDRNRGYRALRKYPTEDKAVEYKRLRARARRVIKTAKKKKNWRRYCGKLGAETAVADIWWTVHRMSGSNIKKKMPVLEEEGLVATHDLDKAKLCENNFRVVHSGANIGEAGIRKRKEKLEQNRDKL